MGFWKGIKKGIKDLSNKGVNFVNKNLGSTLNDASSYLGNTLQQVIGGAVSGIVGGKNGDGVGKVVDDATKNLSGPVSGMLNINPPQEFLEHADITRELQGGNTPSKPEMTPYTRWDAFKSWARANWQYVAIPIIVIGAIIAAAKTKFFGLIKKRGF